MSGVLICFGPVWFALFAKFDTQSRLSGRDWLGVVQASRAPEYSSLPTFQPSNILGARRKCASIFD